MLFDILLKLFRKYLSQGLYDALRRTKIGRFTSYHSLATYCSVFDKYCSHGLDFQEKTVLELGPGLQFYTAFSFLAHGAKNVILVDPVFDPHHVNSIMNAQKDEFTKAYPELGGTIDTSKINIFSTLDSVPGFYNGNVDILCSNFVLEHLENIDDYFEQTRRLLAPRGDCDNFVDLSDHTYHIFYSIPWMRDVYFSRLLYHLRYSNVLFSLLNDKRTWTNRILFPVYVQKAEQYGFQIKSKDLLACPKSPIHKDLLRRLPPIDDNELYVSHFSFLLSHV